MLQRVRKSCECSAETSPSEQVVVVVLLLLALVLLGWGGGRGGQGSAGRGASQCSCLPATRKVLFSPIPHNPIGSKYLFKSLSPQKQYFCSVIYSLYGRQIFKSTAVTL